MQDSTGASADSNISKLDVKPRIIPRAEHNVSRDNISPNALKVLYRLKNAGFQAYMVGGGVRDLLLGREPKDFDVVTDALPEQVRELFRNCRLIGRRFRLAHVRFGQEIIEVSTFRATVDAEEVEDESREGRILRDNVYGSVDEDVWRRDFTVNALLYNIEDFSIVDYVGGLHDIKTGNLRLIGEPERRYREDPVRMLRAVRFAVKLGFRIHEDTQKPLPELAHLLDDIPAARLFEEFLKLFLSGYAVQTFEALRHHGLFAYLFPQTEASLSAQEGGFPHTFAIRALANTDQRLAENKPVTPAFLIAALLWDPLRQQSEAYVAEGMNTHQAQQLASDDVVSKQIASIALPRRFTLVAKDIWALQARLEAQAGRQGKRATKLLTHPRFRAAYDFLLLRAAAGEPVQDIAEFWTELQVDMPAVPDREEDPRSPRRRRRRGGRRRQSKPDNDS
ncbi:poly(A) polymerase [Methylohalomonas lacus]|uniref:Poly(A) polymerase I n=1 Tax=Methylohalomonas lacus TaxID=398773 RepID=A0AAE3HH40_9GAMM|nr:polynucleotide adenylyltransferase PcnB [Methylohalomonas lacus]MCS3902175.1 poly(A) polymerase [Methylohalomonas lacus]